MFDLHKVIITQDTQQQFNNVTMIRFDIGDLHVYNDYHLNLKKKKKKNIDST